MIESMPSQEEALVRQTAIRCAAFLKKFCAIQKSCEGCPFDKYPAIYCRIGEMGYPENWNIPEEEEVKD